MQTPIADFLEKYEDSGMIRFHMPGHKGKADPYDITEVNGADSLYEADGIIRESEENAAALFGSKRTLIPQKVRAFRSVRCSSLR